MRRGRMSVRERSASFPTDVSEFPEFRKWYEVNNPFGIADRLEREKQERLGELEVRRDPEGIADKLTEIARDVESAKDEIPKDVMKFLFELWGMRKAIPANPEPSDMNYFDSLSRKGEKLYKKYK